jgi:hypothetical protein
MPSPQYEGMAVSEESGRVWPVWPFWIVGFFVFRYVNGWIAEQFPTLESYRAGAVIAGVLAAISIYLWWTFHKDEGIARETVSRVGYLAVGLTLVASVMLFNAFPEVVDGCYKYRDDADLYDFCDEQRDARRESRYRGQ